MLTTSGMKFIAEVAIDRHAARKNGALLARSYA
jgi:hypothetical protein